MVRRAAAVLSLAGAWCAWTVLAPRLDQPSTNGMLAAVALIALPLATGIVAALAAGFYDQRRVLAVVVAVGWALALAGTLTDYQTVAGLGKILGAGALGLLFVGLLEKAWHVAAVAVLVIGVDTYSVFAGTDEAPARVGRRRRVDVHGPDQRPRRVRGGRPRRRRLPVPRPVLRGRAQLAAAAAADHPALHAVVLAVDRRCRARAPVGARAAAAVAGVRAPEPAAVPAGRAGPAVGAAHAPRHDRERAAECDRQAGPADAVGERAGRDVGGRRSALRQGAVVGIVGAGNCDDIPLARIAERAGRVDLLDLDPAACRGAIGHAPRALRPRLDAIEADASGGHADRISAAVVAGRVTQVPGPDWSPFGNGPYDLLVGDLLLLAAALPGPPGRRCRRRADHARPDDLRAGPDRPRRVAHARQRTGRRGRPHPRPVGWWRGHEQPFTLDHVLAVARHSADDALELLQSGSGPEGTNPRLSLAALGIPILRTSFWRWPFGPGIDYLACATVAALPAGLRPRS